MHLGINRLNESRNTLNEFERNLVNSVERELRKPVERRKITPKQKQCVFKILQSHGFAIS